MAAGLAVVVLWRYRNVLPIDLLAELALPWLWMILWTVAAWAPGRALGHWIAGGEEESAGSVSTLALGSACLALTGAFLAWMGVLRPPVVLTVLGISAAAGVPLLRRDRSAIARELDGIPIPVLVTIGAAALAIATTLPAPPVMYDTLNYHLAFPARWLRAGRFVEFPRHAFSYYPAAGGMAYTYALALLGPWAAKALHLWAGLLAAAAAGSMGRRLGGRTAGAWAAVIFFLTPSVLQSSAFATADLWVAAWGGSALLLLLRAGGHDGKRMGSFAGAGFLAGSAAAAKILGLATVVLPLGLVAISLVFLGARAQRRWFPLAAFGASAAAPLAPWLFRNLIWTGNPFYPYLRSLFGGPSAGISIAGELAQNGPVPDGLAGRVLDVALALGTRTFHPLQVAANIGPLWLILLPVALLLPAIRRRRLFAPLLVAVVSGLLAWGALVQFGRFLLPVLIGGAVLAGSAMAELSRSRGLPVASGALVVLAAGILCWNATVVLEPLSVERLEVTTGVLGSDDLLSHWVSYWPAARSIDGSLPRDATILMVAESRTLYVERDVVVEDPYRVSLLAELAAASRDRHDLAERLRGMGITHLLVNEREMPRLAALRRVPDYWHGAGVHGMEVLHDFLKHGVRRVFEAPGLWVAELVGPPLSGATSGGDLTPRSRTAPDGTGGSPGG